MSIKLYGASDDLIEVEGDIREEFDPNYDDPSVLAFSDGSIIKAVYDKEGVWRFSPLIRGTAAYSIVQDKVDGDSDVVTLDGDITWVLFGAEWRLGTKPGAVFA